MSSSISLLEALSTLLAMGKSHVGDIETGLEGGLYDAKDNADLDSKKAAIITIEQYTATLREQQEEISVCKSVVADMVATFGDAVINDEEINGGDVVEKLVEWVVQAQAVLN